MAVAPDKTQMTAKQKKNEEFLITTEFVGNKAEVKRDTTMRVNGISAKRGSSGLQMVGYTTLEQFYRGDQWSQDEPAGASQRTDNYCAVIVDNLSSLIFDDDPEISCPTDDPTDDLLELMAEAKERLLWRVWEDNDFDTEFDELSKVGSLYGDTFIKGPWWDSEEKKILFTHIENPSSIAPIFEDSIAKKLHGYIHHNQVSLMKAERKWGELAKARDIKLSAAVDKTPFFGLAGTSDVPTVTIDEYWTKNRVAFFVQDKLLDYYNHNWGFVTLEMIKNIHSPNHQFGKSDIEDTLDPQMMYNRTTNDLANLLKWISTVNLWGKNLEGMQAMVAGLSRIYSLPDDGEIHAFEKTGDPYITNTFAQGRRSAIIELSGISESLLSTSQVSASSGRALAMAFQGTIRKIGPKSKRFKKALRSLNSNILKLYEIYFPETKQIIRGDYRNKVHLPQTLLRNIVDTINKVQSGIISQETAMREAGVQQPKLEKKLMKKDLLDPILGPQIARQPSLLPRLNEGDNQQGDQPNPAPGNAASASQGGAVAANNNTASGAAPTPTE